MRVLLYITPLLLFSGCIFDNVFGDYTALDACRGICKCEETSPSAIQQCTTTCVAEVEPLGVSGACFSCIVEQTNTCSNEDQCDLVCDGGGDPPDPGGATLGTACDAFCGCITGDSPGGAAFEECVTDSCIPALVDATQACYVCLTDEEEFCDVNSCSGTCPF